jgi:hypothetical protein
MITIKRGDGIVEEMTTGEFTRWMCLVEAFHFIEEKAKDLNVDPIDMIKPLAIESYIKDRFPAMLHDVECEASLGNI